MQITAKNPGAANLMAHLCSELDIARFVNNMVTWDEKQWKVSPGTLITALVINTLVQRTLLYNVERFYDGMDMPLLFDETLQAQDLNDDALGRALDRLAEIDCRQLLGAVACRVARIENMDIRLVHGYSKDKRPDLKQFKYGLMVTKEGFPLVGDVVSGNQSDCVWNKKILKEFEVSFLETWNVVYVADSALITKENIQAMQAKKIRFISLQSCTRASR